MPATLVSREDVTDAVQTQVDIQLGTFKRTYRLWETTAPARYDYHGTLHLYGPLNPDKDESRFVLIPDGLGLAPIGRGTGPGEEPYQVGRYRSGLYATVRAEFFDRTQIGEMLVEALYAQAYKGGE